MQKYSLYKLAELLDLPVKGADIELTGVGALLSARKSEISFFVKKNPQMQLKDSQAGAFLTSQEFAEEVSSAIISENVQYDWSRLLGYFAPSVGSFSGMSKESYIDESAIIGEDCTIYPQVFISKGSSIGKGSTLYPGVFIGENVTIGENALLYPNVSVLYGTYIGNNCILHAGVVIGTDGYSYTWHNNQHVKTPQIGTVYIEDDVEIGANTTIDRAALERTFIGKGTKIDNLVQIGHNCQVGEHCLIVSQVGIAGSTSLGKGVVLGGQVGLRDHIHIGDGVQIAAKSGIAGDIEAGSIIAGIPGVPAQSFLKNSIALQKLPSTLKKIRALEKKLEELETKINEKDK